MTTHAMEPTTEITVPLLEGDAEGDSEAGTAAGAKVGSGPAGAKVGSGPAGARVGSGPTGAKLGGEVGVNLTFDLKSQFCFGLKKT
jgi:hypothetical protein